MVAASISKVDKMKPPVTITSVQKDSGRYKKDSGVKKKGSVRFKTDSNISQRTPMVRNELPSILGTI